MWLLFIWGKCHKQKVKEKGDFKFPFWEDRNCRSVGRQKAWIVDLLLPFLPHKQKIVKISTISSILFDLSRHFEERSAIITTTTTTTHYVDNIIYINIEGRKWI
jgi:hypothetical protein